MRHGVRADARLGEGVGADQFAGGEARQIFALLLVRAVEDDGQRADGGVRAVGDGERAWRISCATRELTTRPRSAPPYSSGMSIISSPARPPA